MSFKTNPLTRGKKQKALALLQHQQPSQALPLLEQVCRTDRRDVEAWFLLAAARQEIGAFGPAAEAYRQVIALDPEHAEAHFYLGNTCLALGDGPGAVAAFREAARLRPGHLQARLNLGALLELQENFAAAEDTFRETLRLDPDNPELHFNLGNVLHARKQYTEAVECYRQALRLRPRHADTYNNYGNSLAQLERYDEALTCYQEALQLKPKLAATHNNQGNVLMRLRRIEEAVACYEEALRLNPCHAEALSNLGNIRQRTQGRIDEGISWHRRALACEPAYADAHYNLASCLLLKGEFREGWQEYDWRWKRKGGMRRPLPPSSSSWNGNDLDGRSVFLHAEQGIGDEIFFLRFLPWLKYRGAGHITYRPTIKIASLLVRVAGIDRIADTAERPAPKDVVFAIGDLPRLLGMTTTADIPAPIAIAPLPDKLDSMRHALAVLGPPPYLGVTWRAGTGGDEMVLYKESPVDGLAHQLRDILATVLILQRQPRPGEIETFAEALGQPVHDLSALNDDLEQMLALLALLDEYVGVSNTNMHLRAGVGKTARVLVPAPPEWRWMAEGKESPWFPGFTVYRQGYDGNWERAFAELSYDLGKSLRC